MKPGNLIRMSLAQKPEQAYYVPPRARAHRQTAVKSIPSMTSESPLNSKGLIKCHSNPVELTSASENHLNHPKEKPLMKLEEKVTFTLADRLEALNVNASTTIQNRNSEEKRSLRENTVFLKNSQSKCKDKSKHRKSLDTYVPPHRRNQSLNSEIAEESLSPNVIKNESNSVFFEDSFDEDAFQNFRSRKSDSFLYQYEPFELINDDLTLESLSHVLELRNFDANFKENEIFKLLNVTNSMVDIRWISDCSALIVCKSQSIAELVLNGFRNEDSENEDPIKSDINCTRLQNASVAGRKKAFAISEELKEKIPTQRKSRPQTTDFLARQFIGRHLGRMDVLPKNTPLVLSCQSQTQAS